MAIGTAIFLIALGAILRFAVTATIAGVDIQTVGTILMLAGVLGLIVSIFFVVRSSRRMPPGPPPPPAGPPMEPPRR